jgi:hypothetical protein
VQAIAIEEGWIEIKKRKDTADHNPEAIFGREKIIGVRVAERQQKTAKLRASCGSSGIEIRVSPRVISGGFFFATAARGLSTIAATRAGQSQGQATKVAMLGSLDYVTR